MSASAPVHRAWHTAALKIPGERGPERVAKFAAVFFFWGAAWRYLSLLLLSLLLLLFSLVVVFVCLGLFLCLLLVVRLVVRVAACCFDALPHGGACSILPPRSLPFRLGHSLLSLHVK